MFHDLATDTWTSTGAMSSKRYRPACDKSDTYGLVLSGGLYSFVDTVEATTDGSTITAPFDLSAGAGIKDIPSDASKYLNCLVALDSGNLFITGKLNNAILVN